MTTVRVASVRGMPPDTDSVKCGMTEHLKEVAK